MLENSSKEYANNRSLGERIENADGTYGEYRYITFAQLFTRVIRLGRGLRQLCPFINREDPVGVYSVNSSNLQTACLAIHSQSLRVVPLYDTLGAHACEYICNETQLQVIFTTFNHQEDMKKLIVSCPSIKVIIILDKDIESIPEDYLPSSVSIYRFDDVLQSGPEESEYHIREDDWRPSADTICHIFYTSGTTGNPKGVLISHIGIMFTAASFLNGILYRGQEITERDGVFSYLPLAHGYATSVELAVLSRGVRIPYFTGSLKNILPDVKEAAPSLFIGVPRVLNRIKTGIINQFASFNYIKQIFISWCIHFQTLATRKGYRHALLDKLVFNQLTAMFGGNLRFFAVGAAPMNPEDSEFLSVCFNAPLLEGYGLTETSAAAFMTLNNDHSVYGNVGAPFIATEFKLVSCPDIEYTVDDEPCPRGEVCIRGGCLFKGYYKNEEETKKVMDEDGFFHTGDIGRLNPDNSLTIIDRKKNIFKMAQGEYIAAEHLESVYEESPLIGQLFIYGNGHERYLVGIVGVDPVLAIQKMKELNMDVIDYKQEGWEESFKKNVQTSIFHDYVLELLHQKAEKAQLRGFEVIKEIYIESHYESNNMIFAETNNMLTPSFKLKRYNCQKHYQSIIDDLYKKINTTSM
ncbi:hypothetical protein WA158_008362 [Blastocystis sp. Blastoise]